MHISRFCVIAVLMPSLVALAVLPGCSGSAIVTKGKKRPPGEGDVTEVARIPVKADPDVSKDFGTITGKVVYDGTPLPPKDVPYGQTASCCLAKSPFERENKDQTWIVGADGGVKYAVIFVQPLQGKYFQIPPEQLKVEPLVKIDQPYCAFEPRVVTLFPSYYDNDTKDQKSTGQKLLIRNSAQCDHNYKLMPNSEDNQSRNKTIGKDQEDALSGLKPQPKPFTLACDIHGWMRGYGLILEHPYAAVTKDDGTFEIKNAPLGVPLLVYGWHEGVGFLNVLGGEQGKEMTLQPNQSLGTFSIKAKGG